MDLKEIQTLIKFVSKSDVSEVNLKTKDFEIKIKTPLGAPKYVTAPAAPQVVQPQQATAPATTEATVTPTAPEAAAAAKEDDSKYVTVKSPMIGTFYRKPAPDKPLFVNVGDEVKTGQTLCIIEAMKLFNEIESEVSGTIVKILVDDMSPVEYDQPLFLVDPS